MTPLPDQLRCRRLAMARARDATRVAGQISDHLAAGDSVSAELASRAARELALTVARLIDATARLEVFADAAAIIEETRTS